MRSSKRWTILCSFALLCLLVSGATHASGGNSIAAAPILQPGVNVTGGSPTGTVTSRPPEEYWRINLHAGDHLVVDFGEIYSPGWNILVHLYDPTVTDYNIQNAQDRAIGEGDAHQKGELTYTAPTDGAWILEVGTDGNWCCNEAYGYELTAYVSAAPTAPSPKTSTPRSTRAQDVVVASAGDSYSTALGTEPLPTLGGCGRGASAWPELMSYVVVNIACAGAHVGALFDRYKGEQPQISHLKAIKPDAVTLTIGGNDAGFSSVLRNCYLHGCAGGKLNPNGYAIGTLQPKLTTAYVRLARAVGKAPVLVVSYPRLFPKHPQVTHCGWLNNDERLMVNHMGYELHQVMVAAVTAANKQLGRKQVWIVDTQNAFDGHELCSSDPWVFHLSPACLKDLRCGHPIAAGQEALAAIVEKAIASHT